jgi:hypothetical protein
MLSINGNQSGSMDKLTTPLAAVIILLLVSIGFGFWAYAGRQDYKNNTSQKILVAVSAAQKQQKTTDDNNYTVAETKPYLTYNGSSEYGSLVVEYPKTWSAYVVTASADNQSSTPINGYFEPGIIPDVQNSANVFALRIQVISQTYDQIVNNFSSQVKSQLVTVIPYAFPKVPSDVGVRVDGEIEQQIQGSMVIVPIRNTTLEIWTESAGFESDFNNIILPNVSFSP